MSTTNAVPVERSRFKRLLAENLNYFGNIDNTELKPVKKIVTNTEYEEIGCVGYNPPSQTLEATIAIKQPFGYGTDVCFQGTTEYVRFFVDYGSGFEDAGLASAQVYDIPNMNDCAGAPEKPLIFSASLKYQNPKAQCCTHPVLPRVRAILSWQSIPPAGAANAGWLPVWGSVKECNVQLQPRPFSIACLLDEIGLAGGVKVKLPPIYEAVQYVPIPIPDPGPLALAEVAKLYSATPQASKSTPAQVENKVEAHRFTLPYLSSVFSDSGFNPALMAAKNAELKAAGIDLAAVLAALDQTNANTSYEQLECLGLDEVFPERLAATFRIKRPFGYSGTLCTKGSVEYVAFWADWEDKCDFTYLGTVAINLHDFPAIPAQGLCYSAFLPVDLSARRRTCKQPKIGRVRAVLSWSTPPSTTDPNKLETYGNRLDAHVLIKPGASTQPTQPAIRNIGGIPVEDIDGTGLTTTTAVFADFPGTPADAWGLGRPCPFGGRIRIDGDFFLGFWYRVKAKRFVDPITSFTVLATPFDVEKDPVGFTHQTATSGFFPFLDPLTHFNRILAVWDTVGDEHWQVWLEIATAPSEAAIIGTSIMYEVQLDNTAPAGPPAIPLTMDIHIAAGGDCKDSMQGTVVTGNFIADDLHFGGWGLSTEPNTLLTPSNQPTPTPFLASTDPAAGPGGHGWQLDTGSPVIMKPCGYVVRLDVSDRSIVGLPE